MRNGWDICLSWSGGQTIGSLASNIALYNYPPIGRVDFNIKVIYVKISTFCRLSRCLFWIIFIATPSPFAQRCLIFKSKQVKERDVYLDIHLHPRVVVLAVL